MNSLEQRIRESRPADITSDVHRQQLASLLLVRGRLAHEESGSWSLPAYLLSAAGTCTILAVTLLALNSAHLPPANVDPVVQEIVEILDAPVPAGIPVKLSEPPPRPTRTEISFRLAALAEQRRLMGLTLRPAPGPQRL